MDIETISNRILDENFGLEDISHSDEAPSDTEFVDNDESTSLEQSEEVTNEEAPESLDDNSYISEEEFSDDELEHYGVLGMKWGVRKDKPYVRKGKDRKYEDESDQDYKDRMARESQERLAKASAKERLKSQKMQIKSQQKIQRMQLKSQEKNKAAEIRSQKESKKAELKSQRMNKKAEVDKQKEQIKAQEKAQARLDKERRRQEKKSEKEKTKSKPVNTRTLSDQELNAAIQRLRNEQTYKQLALENKPFIKRNATKALAIGGGILLAVGTTIAKEKLTAYGNMKADELLAKKGVVLPANNNLSTDKLVQLIAKAREEGKL